MAEQDTVITPQYSTDAMEGKTPSPAGAQDPVCEEQKQEESDSAQNVNQQHSHELQDSVPTEPESDKDEETDHGSVTGVEKNFASSQANDRENHTAEQREPETVGSPPVSDRMDEQVDGPSPRLNDKLTVINNTNTGAGQDNGKSTDKLLAHEKDMRDNSTSPETLPPQETSVKEEAVEQRNDVETVGPEEMTTEHTGPEDTGGPGGNHTAEQRELETIGSPPLSDRIDEQVDGPSPRLNDELPVINNTNTGAGQGNGTIWFIGVVVLLGAVLASKFLHTEPLPEKKDVLQIDIFLMQLDKVKTQFPSQRPELWRRSKIHLERHLLTAQPTEPVSLILTAGRGAERTLSCLAQGLASSFSRAINASVLQIDGAGKTSQDSDQVKLDIDSQLQGAFEGDKPVAVIHRFEELPPGSTLIFYRYCDHENAAYKRTFLIFTVLLEGEEELPTQLGLSAVEEMVDDHLKKKFLSYGHPVAYDRMDLDKYGGLWSRISHLILPVAAEERIEHEGC